MVAGVTCTRRRVMRGTCEACNKISKRHAALQEPHLREAPARLLPVMMRSLQSCAVLGTFAGEKLVKTIN